MLDPEYLDRAGRMVAAVYSDIEDELCAELVRAMLANDVGSWRSQAALTLLAQGEAPRLREIVERHRGEVDDAVLAEAEDALRRSDAADLAAVKLAMGVDLPSVTNVQIAGVVCTVTQMLERDNIAMADAARTAFWSESARAVTETGTGVLSHTEATWRAALRLARRGIDMVQYRDPTTGNLTARSRADVAVRRHVRSQLSQACATRTLQVCNESGCRFVEVSSHFGARPSHRDWEGRRYSLDGPVTIGGERFEDFGEATGYYGTGGHGALGDRLCGVNCRHQFGPWAPGMPHAYEPNPQHPSGRDGDEIYRLTQTQRRLERAIRDSKRELDAAEQVVHALPGDPKAVRERDRARATLRRRQDALAKLLKDNGDVLSRDVSRERA